MTQSARLLIVGPQGSGKGTQSSRIARSLGVPAVSTGDVFRANIKAGTPLGEQVKAVTAAGNLVSDELTGRIVRDRLSQRDAAAGFLLDGYPRNLRQVADLDAFLSGMSQTVDAVVELSVPRDESIARLRLRATEEGRTDDTDKAIAKRLGIYESQTAPILDVYRDRGILDTVDGVGSLDDVTARIMAALVARGISRPAAV